jgi:hypothetical protein
MGGRGGSHTYIRHGASCNTAHSVQRTKCCWTPLFDQIAEIVMLGDWCESDKDYILQHKVTLSSVSVVRATTSVGTFIQSKRNIIQASDFSSATTTS